MDYNVKPMIHRFQQNGMNIVMDVNSGIVHVVDDVTYKVLAYYNGTNRGNGSGESSQRLRRGRTQ